MSVLNREGVERVLGPVATRRSLTRCVAHLPERWLIWSSCSSIRMKLKSRTDGSLNALGRGTDWLHGTGRNSHNCPTAHHFMALRTGHQHGAWNAAVRHDPLGRPAIRTFDAEILNILHCSFPRWIDRRGRMACNGSSAF